MQSKGLVLALRGVTGKRARLGAFAVILLAVVYLVVGAIYFGADMFGVGSAADAPPNTAADVQLHIGVWLAYLVPLLTLPLHYFAMRQRIVLDGRGIHYRSRLRGIFTAIYPSWSIGWQELTDVSWSIPKNRELLSRVTLHSNRGNRTLTPGYWVAVDGAADGWPTFAVGVNRDRALSLVNDTPIVRVLARMRADLARAAPVDAADPRQRNPNAAADMTPGTVVLAFGFTSLVFYFLVDTYFGAKEYYVGGAPMAALIGAGLVGLALAYLLLRQLEPKRRDKVAYALLFGFGVGLASHPFLARVNAWTDDHGLQAYAYRLGDDYVWHADLGTSPDVHLYLSSSDWWRRFKPGDAYSFKLRKGGLGLWQVDMTPIYDAQREFYEGRSD